MEKINQTTNESNEKKLYLKKIKMQDYGAISNFEFVCQFDNKGNPNPIVLVGKNGSGKTLLLSNILHSLIEIKRNLYSEIPEVDGNNYYRVGTKDYIKDNEEFSYVNLDYSSGAFFTSATVRFPKQFDFNKIKDYEHVNIFDQEIKENGFFNNLGNCTKNAFDSNVFLYFPVDRYYYPKWLNTENKKLSFLVTENFLGKTNTDIIKDNLLSEIENWILDVIIDKYLYEQIPITYKNGEKTETTIQFVGKNAQIQGQINQVIEKIFPNCSRFNSARIGISTKKGRKISIMAKDANGQDIQLIPTFQNLSSGEIMILSMFCSILKEADRLSDDRFLNISEITGVVLIDEIDIHLHSNFAKEILPEVMALFPKIQFIVSSHSPFFLLGMKQKYDDKCSFVGMPDGTLMRDIENFDEIQKCYEMLDSNHSEMVATIASANTRISALERPLILTEGKTDWKHIKNALDFYKKNGRYESLEIEFWENEEDLGDSKLETLLNSLATVNNRHKIIGVFDSDDKIGKKYIEIKCFGKNVFGICIPKHEKYTNGISIEFLYNDDDIKKCDINGRRLYLSNEFKEKSHRLITNNEISTSSNKVDAYYKCGIVKIIDMDVFDLNDNNIALSKNDFESNIINKTYPFDNIELSGFIPLLDKIEEIVKTK